MNAVRQGEWNLIAGKSHEGRTQLADQRKRGGAIPAENVIIIPECLAWIIHESRRLQMRGAEGEAVLSVLRTLRNKADAAGSACPEGKNAGSSEMKFRKPVRKSVYRRYCSI
jgi:hypothetical protein